MKNYFNLLPIMLCCGSGFIKPSLAAMCDFPLQESPASKNNYPAILEAYFFKIGQSGDL